MVALARAQVTDSVTVFGPHALDMAVDLCRSGFEQVTCGCAASRPTGEPSDVLLVDGPLADDALVARLGAATALLGEQGVLVLRLTDIDQDAKVMQALEHARLAPLSTVYDLSCETLVAHRLLRAPRMAMAA